MTIFVSAVIIFFACIITATIWLSAELRKEKSRYAELLSQKKSSEVRLGQISERLAPVLNEFKYNPKRARFIGYPIDYVIFEDDKIVFLEVKSGGSRLSKSQLKVKELIVNGLVEFNTLRIN